MKTRIVRDPKFPGTAFWLHVSNDPTAPGELKFLLGGDDSITVPDERVEAIIDYCEKVPGYSGGPHPNYTAIYFVG